jgi:hypothetical protein
MPLRMAAEQDKDGVVVLPLYCCYSRRCAATLSSVGEQDWLDKGHGGGEGLQPMIKGSPSPAADRVSIRSVLRGPVSGTPRSPRLRNKALVGWLLYCATAVGGTAAAFTVRDTLFPSLGAPTDNRVWVRPSSDTTLTTERGSSSTANVDTTAATVATTTATTPPSVEAQTVPTVSNPEQGPSDTIDSSGPGSGGATPPVTTVDDQPDGPGPGTTVADRPTDTSTPGSPPSSVDATPPSAPGDTSPGHQSGKGGGGGGDDPPTP